MAIHSWLSYLDYSGETLWHDMVWYTSCLVWSPLACVSLYNSICKMGERNKKITLVCEFYKYQLCMTYTPQNLKAFINLIYPSTIASLNGAYTSKTFVLYKSVGILVLWPACLYVWGLLIIFYLVLTYSIKISNCFFRKLFFLTHPYFHLVLFECVWKLSSRQTTFNFYPVWPKE